ncbi:MAG: cobalt-precorrin-5B (C(1))-methyltransferase CbiD [Desulfosalsimonas sp.]
MSGERRQKRRLRWGFTTGTAAAAAAKAAGLVLLEGRIPSAVKISLPAGYDIEIPVHSCSITNESSAVCTVIKDAGDDPDATHGAEIGAKVRLSAAHDGIVITGGTGVGQVTRPGLEVAPGEPAINPGPQKIITQSLNEVLNAHSGKTGLHAEIFVPRGEKIATRTLNARLGIIGGISILGTTGVVKPMSHEAYVATISSAMSVAGASGTDTVVCATGRRSERYAMEMFAGLAEPAFVQIGDYFEKSMKLAAKNGFKKIVLAVFFGKAVKMAQGTPHTHAAKSRMGLDQLAEWAVRISGDTGLAEKIASSNTARQAFFMIRKTCPALLEHTAERMILSAADFSKARAGIRAVIFDYEGGAAADIVRTREEL